MDYSTKSELKSMSKDNYELSGLIVNRATCEADRLNYVACMAKHGNRIAKCIHDMERIRICNANLRASLNK